MSELPYNLVYLVIGGAAWAVAWLKLRAWRRDPSFGLLVVTLAVASPATAFLLASPLLYRAVGRLTGVGNLATLLVYLGVVGFSAAAMVLALVWAPPEERAGDQVWAPLDGRLRQRVRRRTAVFATLVPVLVALFLIGGPYRPETPLTFDTTFAPRAATALFLALYQGLFAYALIDIGRVCLGHAARLPAGWLRRGIRLLASGALTACGYVVCKIAALALGNAGVDGVEWLSTALGPAFAALGAVGITLGFAGPAGAAWTSRRRDFRALRPLWDLVYRADRRLALEGPPSPAWRERVALRDLEWRTTRRGLEIRDGQLTLRPWIDPAAVRGAERFAEQSALDPDERDALVVAAALRSAIDGLAAKAVPRPREEQPVLPGLDADPAEERAHLVLVASFLQSPLLERALAEQS
ncbi:MAB_1171c family putative transporter [Kitasatospora sp. NPDC092948]|uniref:MAB_1171c family putative transporter n=1 Tax=Kitasatospora sp. NPDC092948 TaxID=3364088 RepID=UPI0037F17263